MSNIQKSLFLSLIIASISFLNLNPVAAGGSSFSITELNPGSKVFQPSQEDQLLFSFTVNPTYGGDFKLKNFQLNCGPEHVFQTASLLQSNKLVDTAVMSDEVNSGMQSILFTHSDTIPKTQETLFQVKVDLKEGIDNTTLVCQTTSMEFEDVETGDIKKMPEYSSGSLSDDASLIFITASDSEKIDDQVVLNQKDLGVNDYPLGTKDALISEFTLQAGQENITVKDVFVFCDGDTADMIKLTTAKNKVEQVPHDIELTYAQAAIFTHLNFVIPAGHTETFSFSQDINAGHYSPYYKKNHCAVTAINFSDEAFKKVDYETLSGGGLDNSKSAFRIYNPKNLTGFSDVSLADPNYEAIKFLRQFDIVDGYEDGTFKPKMEVNRGELAKLLYASSWNSVGEFWNTKFSPKNCFPDVKDEWFSLYVCALKSKNWIQGHPDGNFRPALTVNQAEALKMILLSQGIKLEAVDTGIWYDAYFQKAFEMKVLDPSEKNPAKALNRGEISQMLYRTLIWLDKN